MKVRTILLLAILFLECGNLHAENRETSSLVIGTKQAEPFSIKNQDGTWSGISIDLWKNIAEKMNLDYELREMPLKELLEGVESGTIDAAIAAITINSEREQRMDFSHPYHTTGLGIAVPLKREAGWISGIRPFFSKAFMEVVGVLAVILLVVGFLMWFFERKSNQDQFGEGPLSGIGSGFWWSAVTMTTVGYGDKAPKTFGGRLVAVVWMFVAIIIISSFTAAITSSLTVARLEPGVKGPEDLYRVRVGTIPDSTSSRYLNENNIRYDKYSSAAAGLKALHAGEIDAFVYDAPLLRYIVNNDYSGRLTVLKNTFTRQYYGIAFPTGSPLREPVNRELLMETESPNWKKVTSKYLGGQ